MHLPLLIDPPNTNRFSRLLIMAAVLFFLACLVLSQMWDYSQGQPFLWEHHSKPTPVKKPVRYVTVTEYIHEGCGGSIRTIRQASIIELYSLLYGIENNAKSDTRLLYPNNERKQGAETIRIRAVYEKAMRNVYGLTLEQIEMIKREGYRATHEIWE